MLLHDIIKIKYSNEGYLPNYPPHLISDEEMIDAFLNNDISYFHTNYKLLNPDLQCAYDNIIKAFEYHFNNYLNNNDPIPDWVYTYMLGDVITQFSNVKDRHLLLIGLNEDNIDDEITASAQSKCLQMSQIYVNKLPKHEKEIELENGEVFYTRPPTIFGEPHIVKMIRLSGVLNEVH